ncbi:MAG: GNAT family N-acetyltransferase [Methylophaga sp.]|nr:GNAT family N-acetyltransferase [Methylophaga sp.]
MYQQGMTHWLGVYDEQSVRQNLLQKTVYILKQDSHVSGCVALGIQPADYYADCWPDVPVADFYLTQLAVHPQHQQSGYGRLLLQHCLELINGRTLQLDAVAHYPELLAFYRKAGFSEIAEGIGLGDRRYLFEYGNSTQ